MKPPDHLIELAYRNGPIDETATPRPLLTLEEFFEGNDDPGCIAANLPGSVAPSEFYDVFRKLREHPDVADVRIQITSWDDPMYWPYSDTVLVVASLMPLDIQQRLGKRLYADEISIGPQHAYPVERFEVPRGMRALWVWWD